MNTLKDLKHLKPRVQDTQMHSAHEWMMFEFYYEQAIKDVKKLLLQYKDYWDAIGTMDALGISAFIQELINED